MENNLIKYESNLGNFKSNIDISFSASNIIAITGLSGSGKSTLVLQTLYNALNLTLNNNKSRKIPKPFKGFKGTELIDKIIDIDQSPIGRTPRSNPATYTGAFGPIEIGLQVYQSLKPEDINLEDSLLTSKEVDVKLVKVMES